MVESRDKDKGKKKITEVKEFLVPLALEGIKENITITTNSATKISKERKINQAIRFHLEGNISEATKYYQKLINQGCNDHRVFSNYGIILKDLGQLKEAEISCHKAIKLNPDFAAAHSNLGNILRDLGKLKEAEISYRKSIDLMPDFADAHYNLGNILRDLGKLKEAEISTRKAIELNPNYANSHLNLGNILRDLGKSQEAEISYRKAIELDPDFAIAHSNLGIILSDLGKLKEAEQPFRKTIEIQPEFENAYSRLGNVLFNLGKVDEAIFYCIKAVKLKPEDDKLVNDLALKLCCRGKYELALKYLSKNQSTSSQTICLGCLLSLDREKDFNQKYKELSANQACNADIGGILEHANIIYGKQYESPFCNEAIKYVFIEKINENLFSENHLNELISFNKISRKGKRSQGLLTNGIQTSGNLFSLDYPFIKAIKKALEIKIENYKQIFKDSGQGFIHNWPKDYELRAWMISMKAGGFLKSHNHEYGWITGSFYLQIPNHSNINNDDSGNIAFSYQGPRYPSKEKNFNLTIKKIETRDICIFPSSLFHFTIPFESTEERICFVFDLVQKQ